ncbi:MerR family transcriptional regulator [Rhodococcus sp. H29-C3]|uniref:MerR family transcriptional regulator n=1 Tax=Rhodococcus sp. H29-C3 TaxID=3046307 RepID=UPI0024B8B1A0|nr:MerR family transcriptional regulator [Rhodococcus sp. H29-C3]MDJ0362525.1 MerR family transcriptional regulator [Rhodococcus sp. H29-C3]
MKAGKAAAVAGVSVKALRYYERMDLVRPFRASNGYRVYTDADVQAVVEVRRLMELGLSAREAEPFVACLRAGHDAADECADSIAAYQQKINQMDVMIARMTHAREELTQRMLGAARRGFDLKPTDNNIVEEPMTAPQPGPLPDGLVAPEDDGAAEHLPGSTVPSVSLVATDGTRVSLSAVATGRWVLFVYPLTGEPGVDVPQGWDDIPGARGCSQEACSFRDELAALHETGVAHVIALSSDASAYQRARRPAAPAVPAALGPRPGPGRRDGSAHLHSPDSPAGTLRAATAIQTVDAGLTRDAGRARLLSGLPARHPRHRGRGVAQGSPGVSRQESRESTVTPSFSLTTRAVAASSTRRAHRSAGRLVDRQYGHRHARDAVHHRHRLPVSRARTGGL